MNVKSFLIVFIISILFPPLVFIDFKIKSYLKKFGKFVNDITYDLKLQ